MNTPPPRDYVFGDFHFDANRLALYHKGELVKDVEKKALEVLAALLDKPNELVTHEEIIRHVWHDNPYGVTPARVNQYISKIHKVFAHYDPESKLIENLKGRGYVFVGHVSNASAEIESSETIKPDQAIPTRDDAPVNKVSTSIARTPQRKPQEHIYLIAGLGIFAVIVLSAWMLYRGDDAEEMKRVVKDSQMYESLVLYKNPGSFKEGDLDRYWTTELDLNSNYDRARIRKAVEKLRNEGRRYGDETKCEQFEFQSLDINATKDMGVAKTLEKWFIAEYGPDGKLIKNKYVGPYFVSYILRKIDGRWLIEKSNTARVDRPTPHLDEVEKISEQGSGRQLTIDIVGQDFEPETVSIEITGHNCPDSKPCKVANSSLREKAKLSDKAIRGVPLDLEPGEYSLVLYNGDSKPSEPFKLTVP